MTMPQTDRTLWTHRDPDGTTYRATRAPTDDGAPSQVHVRCEMPLPWFDDPSMAVATHITISSLAYEDRYGEPGFLRAVRDHLRTVAQLRARRVMPPLTCADIHQRYPGMAECCSSCHADLDYGYEFTRWRLPDGRPVASCCGVRTAFAQWGWVRPFHDEESQSEPEPRSHPRQP